MEIRARRLSIIEGAIVPPDYRGMFEQCRRFGDDTVWAKSLPVRVARALILEIDGNRFARLVRYARAPFERIGQGCRSAFRLGANAVGLYSAANRRAVPNRCSSATDAASAESVMTPIQAFAAFQMKRRMARIEARIERWPNHLAESPGLRRPDPAVLRSDQQSRYAPIALGERCHVAGGDENRKRPAFPSGMMAVTQWRRARFRGGIGFVRTANGEFTDF